MGPSKFNLLKRAAADDAGARNGSDSPPPRSKRKRIAEPDQAQDGESISLENGELSANKLEGVVDSLLQKLQQVKDYQPDVSPPTPASRESSSDILIFMGRGLLELRTWQRELLQRCSTLDDSCQKLAQNKQRQEQIRSALEYEKSHLKQEIATVENFTMPHLDQILQQNLNDSTLSNGHEHENHALVLSKLDPNDPSHRTAILQHLQAEIQQRSKLEKKRNELKAKLKTMHQDCKKQQEVLNNQLPRQLSSLEHATKPLQQWFGLPCIGTERAERLRLAQELSPPLYTLFVSLQEYLDLIDTTQPPDELPPMSIKVVPIIAMTSSSTQPYELQWILPVPDITASGATFHSNKNSTTNRKQGRSVTIHFQHSTGEVSGPRCIRTSVSGCAAGLDQTILLSSLFPNDDFKSAQQSQTHQYYRWSHYLAGIHLPPATNEVSSAATMIATPTITTTRAIVQTLQRRIRGNATLKHILQTMQQHHKIPTLPESKHMKMFDKNNSPSAVSSWQLISFMPQPQSDKDSSVFTYDLHCKTKSGTRLDVRAEVVVDKAQYPSVTPRWTLASSTPTEKNGAASSGLFNASWKLMESALNEDIITSRSDEDDSKNLSSGEKMDVEDEREEESTEEESNLLFAEWILAHQLHKLLAEWEHVASATSTTMATDSGSRSVRGRDRVPTSFSKH